MILYVYSLPCNLPPLFSFSRYEMYAEESRAASSATNDPNFSENLQSGLTAESRPALEVVELANGETIW